MRRTARTAADGVGAREWLEMGGEKKPLVMSELGCGSDGCGRHAGHNKTVMLDGEEIVQWVRRTARHLRLRTAWGQAGLNVAANGVGGKGRERKEGRESRWER